MPDLSGAFFFIIGGRREGVVRQHVLSELMQYFVEMESGALRGVVSLFALALGLLVGSFLNVVIYRVPLSRSIVLPPSACTVCNTPLAWYQNVPVVSYLLLRGRCRFCGTTFSFRYAALELLTGVFFLYCQQIDGMFSWFFLKSAVLFSLCLVVFFIDLDHWIIPDGINLFGVVAGVMFSVLEPFNVPEWVSRYAGGIGGSVLWSLLGALVGYMFFYSIQVVGLLLVKQEAMGGGDVKFAALIGAFLGPGIALWAFLFSFFLGALYAIPLVVLKRGGGKDPIPFGTFMAVAAIVFQIVDQEALLARFEEIFLWELAPY